MNPTRRRSLLLFASAPILIASGQANAAETTSYQYDVLGRLVRVGYSNGIVATYQYDAGGNRAQTQRLSATAPFAATIAISGTGPVNLRTLADAAGYSGESAATITFVNNGTIAGVAPYSGVANGGYGLDTGTWPHATHTIALTLDNNGTIRGGGGAGGAQSFPGGTSAAGAGGDAVYARVNLTIDNVGGAIRGGGGGGGLGANGQTGGPISLPVAGGGGGGGFPNGSGGGSVTITSTGQSGAPGTLSGGGAGGAGTPGNSGNGGNGGNAGSAGANGGANYLGTPGGVGGAVGYAVRKNGFTVTRTGGTVVGPEG